MLRSSGSSGAVALQRRTVGYWMAASGVNTRWNSFPRKGDVADPDETLWPLEPHTLGKHLVLRAYLDAWLPIMARWNGRILFIDGFAGPGEYSTGEDGSPIIALKA